MKIAVLTQPLKKNYGGIMQAYALQRVVSKLGHDVVTVNRQPDRKGFFTVLLRSTKLVILKALGKSGITVLSAKEEQYVFYGMTEFVRKYITTTEPIHSERKLIQHFEAEDYDGVIVGSDQVWRPRYSPNIYNYFLNFVSENVKAISYAASFGVSEWEFTENQTKKCKELISRFSAVSVRERDAVSLCSEMLGVKAELVLDPTLLLDREEYEKLIESYSADSNKKKGVLSYILDKSEEKNSLVHSVSKRLGEPVFKAQPLRPLTDGGGCLNDYKYPAVEDWVKSFRDASFVVTDSFHGCVFSIIFNKPFLVVGNHDRGLSRFVSLLSTLGLDKRLILSGEDGVYSEYMQDIDWIHVNRVWKAEREKSLRFIINSL